jgi:hypothetical protein
VQRNAPRSISLSSPGFIDSEGQVNLPFSAAVRLSEAFAATESQTVLFTVDMVEQKYESEARERDDHLFLLVQHWKAGCPLLSVGCLCPARCRDRAMKRVI